MRREMERVSTRLQRRKEKRLKLNASRLNRLGEFSGETGKGKAVSDARTVDAPECGAIWTTQSSRGETLNPREAA